MEKIKINIIIILFIWMSISSYLLFKSPIEDRLDELVPGLISFFSFPSFEEGITNFDQRYDAQVYVYNFPDFDKVDQCVLHEVTEDNLKAIFRKVHEPYGAGQFIPKTGSICVRIIELEEDIEILITHKGGVIYFIYSK